MECPWEAQGSIPYAFRYYSIAPKKSAVLEPFATSQLKYQILSPAQAVPHHSS